MTEMIDIPGVGAIKVTVSEDQPPGIIGMISRGPDFASVAVCALTDPPVAKARTIRDEVLMAEVRDQYRDLGLDEDSIAEALATARDAGMFDVPG